MIELVTETRAANNRTVVIWELGFEEEKTKGNRAWRIDRMSAFEDRDLEVAPTNSGVGSRESRKRKNACWGPLGVGRWGPAATFETLGRWEPAAT
jgi:hypothetical protein